MSEPIKQEKAFYVKKLQIIMILSIISIVGIPVGFVLFLILPILLAWLGWVITGIFTVIPIILGIIILTTDWKNHIVDNSKILWGVFSIVLLGPIASLIFSVKSRKAYLYDDSSIDDLEDTNTEE